MVHRWYHIAKAEYFVVTSGRRRHRHLFTAAVYVVALLYAVVLAPRLVDYVIGVGIPMSVVRTGLMAVFPGLMRGAMLYLWIMLLLYPLSNALQEIKIGQWEILISHGVKTRDILIGTFLGRIPVYVIVVLVFAPILIAPFMFAFEVSTFGQILVYTVVAVAVLSTVWLSNLIVAVIQGRLGQSARGNDIAKALSVVIALIAILPVYVLIFYMSSVSQLLGMNAFLLMPFAWPADIISWVTIFFNGIGLTEAQIVAFSSVLQLDPLTSTLLMIAFGFLFVVVGLVSADRVFTISPGARTEKITATGRENLLIRGVRRANKGSFGALTATSLKLFGRKAETVSKMFYSIIVGSLYPVMWSQVYRGSPNVLVVTMVTDIIIAMLGVLPFAGSSVLDSKDQLWMIQSAPRGGSRFLRARLASGFLIAFPIAFIPSIVVALVFGMAFADYIVFLFSAFFVVSGGAMVGIGLTARFPNYEDVKSRAYQFVILSSMMLTVVMVMAPIFLYIFGLLADFDVFTFVLTNFGTTGYNLFMLLTGPLCLLLVGAVIMSVGSRSLSRPEK